MNEMNKCSETTLSGPDKEVKHGWFQSSLSRVRTVNSGVSFTLYHSRKLYILYLCTVGSHIHFLPAVNRFLMDLQSSLFTGQSFVNLSTWEECVIYVQVSGCASRLVLSVNTE